MSNIAVMEEVKLNLGCYDKQLPGFINVDIRPECNPDVVDDAATLKKFNKDSVDLIYSSHCLEHFPRDEVVTVLNRWYEVLKPGGVLRLAVPDFEALCKRYMYTGDVLEVRNSILGSAKHDYDFHYHLFDFEYLSGLLFDAGFDVVERFDWFSTHPHNYCDDFSHAYLPSDEPDIALSHGRLIKGKGMLVSLNLEAVK